MKKILFTLMAVALISFSVNAQAQKSKTQAKTSPVTMASLFSDFKTALSSTSITKAQQSYCREYFIWSIRNKERINGDSTLSAAAKQDQINAVNTKLNDKFTQVMNANDLKIVAPFMK